MKDFDVLFKSVGFVHKYRDENESFFHPYFRCQEELNDFFYSVFQHDTISKKPRQMMNYIRWYVSLANDIDKIRPGKDPLRILFLRIGLESLCKVDGSSLKEFFQSFPSYFTENGRQ